MNGCNRIVLGLLLFLNLVVRAQESPARADIEALSQKWAELWNKKDAGALTELYTADSQRFIPDIGVVKGRDEIRKILETGMKIAGDNIEKFKTLDVIGEGSFATETGLWRSETPDGSLTEEGTFVTVWKKDGADWKILRDTWNVTNKKEKLIAELEPLQRLLGNWTTDGEIQGAAVRGTFSWTPVAEGIAIAYEGAVWVSGELASQWAGLIYYRPESKTIVDVGTSRNEGHGSSTIHVLDNKLVYQGTGVDQEGRRVTNVDQVVFDGKSLRYSQLHVFKDGKPEPDLLKNVELKPVRSSSM